MRCAKASFDVKGDIVFLILGPGFEPSVRARFGEVLAAGNARGGSCVQARDAEQHLESEPAMTARRGWGSISLGALALLVVGTGTVWFAEGRRVDYRAAVRGQEYALGAGPRAACLSDHLIVRYDELGGLGTNALRFEFLEKGPVSGAWVERGAVVQTSGPICAVGAARDGRTFALASMRGGGELVLELLEFPGRPGGPRIVAEDRSDASRLGFRGREVMPDVYAPPVGKIAPAPQRRTLYAGTGLAAIRILMVEPEGGHLLAVDVEGRAVQFDLGGPPRAKPRALCADMPRDALRQMLRGRWMEGEDGCRYAVLDAARMEGCLRYPGPGPVVGTDAGADGSFESLIAWDEGEWRSRCQDRNDPVLGLGIRVH